MSDIELRRFIVQSNMIEGIFGDPTQAQIKAHKTLLGLDELTVSDMESFVAEVAGAELRRKKGMDVRVGDHYPPPGGPNIEMLLDHILRKANGRTPWAVHLDYETLHPFMDGNGRSGRALWLWMMRGHRLPTLGFLHAFYYQTLGESRP